MRNWIVYGFVTLLGLGFCLFVLGLVIVRFYQVPNASMEPTLREGDSLLLVRHVVSRNLRRGELATFYLPEEAEQVAVSRVVGLPGDKVRVSSGRLILNGQQLAEPYVHVGANPKAGDFPTSLDSLFDVGGEARRLQSVMYGEWVKDGNLVVPDGYYFMLGDNRNQALDSRNFGPVPQGNILTRPIYVYQTRSGSGRRLIDSYIIGAPPP
jgi:signal peptidase I